MQQQWGWLIVIYLSLIGFNNLQQVRWMLVI